MGDAKKKQVWKQMRQLNESNPEVKRTDKVPTLNDVNALHLMLNLDDSVNEKLLMHGTSAQKVLRIVSFGFDERMVSRGSFGNGTYLAEDPSKMDQYVLADSADTKDPEVQQLHDLIYGSREHP